MPQRASKRRGRPSREPTQGERVGLSLRVTPQTKRDLDHAAEMSGRSLSQEAESRLEQSFQEETRIPEIMNRIYGSQLADFLMSIGSILREWGPQVGYSLTRTVEGAHNWFDLRFAFDQAKEAIDLVMEAIRPVGGPEPKPEPFEDLKLYGTIPGIAFQYLEAVADPTRSDAAELRERLGRWSDRIRENLDELREKFTPPGESE